MSVTIRNIRHTKMTTMTDRFKKKKRKERKISEPEKAGRQLDVAGNVSSDQKTAHFNENELTVL